MPEVAVITPTYNRGHTGMLDKSMRSVIAQTYEDFSYIVVDDGSTDNTPEIVGKFASRDRRIKYYRRARSPRQKLSSSAATNYGIKRAFEAGADFVAFLHSDDMYASRFLEKEVAGLGAGIKLVYSWMGHCDQNMRPVRVERWNGPADPKGIANTLRTRRKEHFQYHTALVSREVVEKTGGYDENMSFCEDREFYMRLLSGLEECEIACVPEVLYYYRIHDCSITGVYRANGAMHAERAYLASKHRKTAAESIVDFAVTALTAPHKLLPEPAKRCLRPLDIALSRGAFAVDPKVLAIENHAE